MDEHALEVMDAVGARGEARGGARGAQELGSYARKGVPLGCVQTWRVVRGASCMAKIETKAKAAVATSMVVVVVLAASERRGGARAEGLNPPRA